MGPQKNSDLYGTGPLRPDIHEVQKGPTGEQETQWIRRTNRQNKYFKMQVFCLSRSSESLSLQHGGFVLSVCEHSYQRRLVLKDNKHIKTKILRFMLEAP